MGDRRRQEGGGGCGDVFERIGFLRESTFERVQRGTADANIRFDDLRNLLTWLGFSERVNGSHHIFTRPGIEEILNIQPRGSLAKAYQVKQVRKVITRYMLVGE